jgi:hypothetical protein
MVVFAIGGCDGLALGGAEAILFWAQILPSYRKCDQNSLETDGRDRSRTFTNSKLTLLK